MFLFNMQCAKIHEIVHKYNVSQYLTPVTATAADLQQQYLGSGCVRSTLRSYRCSCIGVGNYWHCWIDRYDQQVNIVWLCGRARGV